MMRALACDYRLSFLSLAYQLLPSGYLPELKDPITSPDIDGLAGMLSLLEDDHSICVHLEARATNALAQFLTCQH